MGAVPKWLSTLLLLSCLCYYCVLLGLLWDLALLDSSYPMFPKSVFTRRGVQYVHCVMHKCIMVKVGGGKEKHKICKKYVNLTKSGGHFFKVG